MYLPVGGSFRFEGDYGQRTIRGSRSVCSPNLFRCYGLEKRRSADCSTPIVRYEPTTFLQAPECPFDPMSCAFRQDAGLESLSISHITMGKAATCACPGEGIGLEYGREKFGSG